MAICSPKVKFISTVPQSILDVLWDKLNSWNYVTDDFSKSDIVFLKSNTFSFLENIDSIAEVINWCKETTGLKSSSVMRSMFNAIPPYTKCPAHIDTVNFHRYARRFHIPLLNSKDGNHYTFEKIDNEWEITKWHMEYGQLWASVFS